MQGKVERNAFQEYRGLQSIDISSRDRLTAKERCSFRLLPASPANTKEEMMLGRTWENNVQAADTRTGMQRGGPCVTPVATSIQIHRNSLELSAYERKQRDSSPNRWVQSCPSNVANLKVNPDLLFRFLSSSSWFRGGMSLKQENEDN